VIISVVCVFLIILTFFASYSISQEGIRIERIARLFSDPSGLFDQELAQNTLDVDKILQGLGRETNQIFIADSQIEMLDAYSEGLSDLRNAISTSPDANGLLDILSNRHRDYQARIVDFNFLAVDESRRNSQAYVRLFGSPSARDVELIIGEGDYFLTFSLLTFVRMDATPVYSHVPILALAGEDARWIDQFEGKLSREDYLEVRRSSVEAIDNALDKAREIEGQIREERGGDKAVVRDRLTRELQVLAYDPWGDLYNVVRYTILLIMIYSIFYGSLRVIVKKIAMIDGLMTIRVKAIYFGRTDMLSNNLSSWTKTTVKEGEFRNVDPTRHINEATGLFGRLFRRRG